MIIDDIHYDVIVIGSGAGGGTLAGALTRKGKNVLVLERGGAMSLDDQNVADVDLFRKDRYHPKNESWFGPDGYPFAPHTNYALGGNSKIWGAVLERMREEDFREVALQEGVSPAWPFDYDEMEPYYGQAEALYQVHGQSGVDPTEPSRHNDFVAGPKPVEPFLEPLRTALKRQGCQPYDIPMSWSDDQEDPSGDAQLFGINLGDPERLTVRTNSRVMRLHVNPEGRKVRGVEAEVNGDIWLFRSDVVVLAAGAVNTPCLLYTSDAADEP